MLFRLQKQEEEEEEEEKIFQVNYIIIWKSREFISRIAKEQIILQLAKGKKKKPISQKWIPQNSSPTTFVFFH